MEIRFNFLNIIKDIMFIWMFLIHLPIELNLCIVALAALDQWMRTKEEEVQFDVLHILGGH